MQKVFSVLFFFSVSMVMASNSHGQNRDNSFVGYYNSSYSKDDYKIVRGTIYFKSNTASISSISFGGITTDSSPGNINVASNGEFSTTLYINGFKRTDNRYNFTYSLCTTFEDGKIYQKSENMTGYVASDPFILQFAYKTPALKPGAPSRALYMNFLIKDTSSDAVIQGYILMSGHPKLQEIAEYAGADAFIKKPFDIEDIRNIIKKVLFFPKQ